MINQTNETNQTNQINEINETNEINQTNETNETNEINQTNQKDQGGELLQIKYSEHLENRLSLRKIEHQLPRKIFELSNERYFDEETGHFIAIMGIELYNKQREVMVAYEIKGDMATLLTIHPLKENQKDNRVKSGR